MKKIGLLLSAFLIAGNLFGQALIFPEVQMTSKYNKEETIKLTELKVDVKLTGNIAVSTYDMVFTSTSIRTLEGEFNFPLSENQSVIGFALDINGKMREGVVVEKDKGRQVYETIVRNSIDPGLLERTEGNNYKARVYPFRPRGSRRVQIKVQEELKGKTELVVNPITKEKLSKFSFNFYDYRDSKTTGSGNNDSIVLTTGNMGSVEKTDFSWEAPVRVPLKALQNKADVFIQTIGTDSYFYVEVPASAGIRRKPKVESAAVFFDTSLSRKKCNLEKELSLLKLYLNNQVKTSVEIIEFSNEIKSVNTFQADDWVGIEKCIRDFCYDGATNLSSASGYKTKAEEILLFTDGLANWTEKSVFNSSIQINTISSSVSADYSELKKIARNNKGSFVNLSQLSVEQGEALLENQQFKLLKAEYDDKALSQVYPACGTVADEGFSVAGILKRKNGKLKLSFGYGTEVEVEKTVEVSAVTGCESDYIGRLWASKKIEELSFEKEKNKNQIMELAQKFTIVTEDTSLIVLENAAEYFRYGIQPPEELRAEYDAFVSHNKRPVKQGIPEDVYKVFRDFKKWWENPIEYVREKTNIKEKDARNTEVLNGVQLAASRASLRASEADEDFVVYDEGEVSERLTAAEPEADDSLTEESADGAVISIQAWNPDVEYLRTLKKTPEEEMYSVYLELRKEYAASPSFYMDVADYFFSENHKEEAVRIISNMMELELENPDMLRALGNKLMDFKEYKKAAFVFEKLVELRPEIPQFLRDAAKAYDNCGEYQKACDLLYKVVTEIWDTRYNEIQQVCLNDMNAIIAKANVNTSLYDKELLQNFPVDIRIVLTWNTDDSDIDLWVIDPDEEKCFYGHKLTQLGGRISRDFTRGYGPEEFCLKDAKKGNYKIVANYFGNHQPRLLQPVVVQAEVYTNFGKPEQKCEVITLQLKDQGGNYTVGEITF